MLDWQTILAVLAVVIAGISLFDKLIGKSLTRYEHEEFRDNYRRSYNDLRDRITRLENISMKDTRDE